ncbi:DnaT-like ssDNA-binding protein [Modicisalibacter coralii]|uniref:DnaT-like ssDNA-binding protein n=1 Tax=Modicisalibacter coralii TaxID=2304602 RepID=UPI00100B8CB1|nr:DnaT-like ssDNA-binding protein [Halomonas coralii]
MVDYVTKADVDTTLGSGWEGSGDADRAVKQANAWLSAELNSRTFETVPTEVVEAGSELARMSAEGTLYADSDGDVKSESVKAGEVEVSTEYQDRSRATNGTLQYVKALLKPWLMPLGVTLLKRL